MLFKEILSTQKFLQVVIFIGNYLDGLGNLESFYFSLV